MEQKEKSKKSTEGGGKDSRKHRPSFSKREEKAKARKEQDHHKFIMGGIIVKYFPERRV